MTVATASSTSPAPTLSEPVRFGRFELRPREQPPARAGRPCRSAAARSICCSRWRSAPASWCTQQRADRAVWPGRVVEENNLACRSTRCARCSGGEWLVTVPGRGYRFTAPPETPELPSAHRRRCASARPRRRTLQTNLPDAQPLADRPQRRSRRRSATLIDSTAWSRSSAPAASARRGSRTRCMAVRAERATRTACAGSSSATSPMPTRCPALWPRRWACARRRRAAGGLARRSPGCRCWWRWTTPSICSPTWPRLRAGPADAAPGLRLVVTSQAPLRLAPSASAARAAGRAARAAAGGAGAGLRRRGAVRRARAGGRRTASC